jgi:hypothetical protein
MPPENAGYAYAAYAAAFTVYTVYVISVWWRGRTLAARIRAAMGADRSAASET